MIPSLDPHIEALTRFAEAHLTGEDDEGIRIKLDHSLRVLDNASAIIGGEAIEGREAWLCRMAALYHDIGRFPQYATYHTFNDRESVNHGRMGVLTLRRLGFPEPVSGPDARIIRFAVAQHNVKTIRPDLRPDIALPLKVVRDADKLDIYRVMIDNFCGDNPDPLITHGVANDPARYSETVYDKLMRDQEGDYNLIRYTNDFLLLIVGWVFRLHLPTTRRLVVERGHLPRIFALLPDDAPIRAFRAKVDAFLGA
ncbi:HD domain-containing protein [Pseudodesulfovibrio sp.]|uniref:HD domain-containing protein n=1 Tax=Pseudodesulfovibrio sp. TaxID=2035812 RepID=UPI002608D821|nr:HD domain-containing protein [Pseudodesulfovibrio sp.]MDD3310648.1 HD domain-containing protein [Pseudodesulfovibrio sp.]